MKMDLDLDDDDVLGDRAAQEVLRDNRLKQNQRKQNDTRHKLGSIQARISRALSKYDLENGKESEYKDFKLDRKQSEQNFDVYIVGFNESVKKKSKLLESLYDFFVLYEDDEVFFSPEYRVDMEESYTAATDAIRCANDSLRRLSNIHTSLVDGYTSKLKDKENKRKTKKLEQAMKDAQNELLALKDTLATSTQSLNEATSKAEGLRKALDMKASEVEKNKLVIEKLRRQGENNLGVDEKKLLKDRTELLSVLEKENTELKLNLAQLEFGRRKIASESVKDMVETDGTQEIINELQNKLNDERERHEESLRVMRAELEAELEEMFQTKCDEFNDEISELNVKLRYQESTIADLESKLEQAKRPATASSIEPESEPLQETSVEEIHVEEVEEEEEEEEVVVSVIMSERTTSAVSVDPTEALNKKFRELESEFETKRKKVEEAMEMSDIQNQSKIEALNKDLDLAKDAWEREKFILESQVEKFRRMVAEMEGEAQEKIHRLSQKLNDEPPPPPSPPSPLSPPLDVEVSSIQESCDESLQGTEYEEHVKPSVIIRPSTAVRNILTPGPENPVIQQVITMYDHVTDFKDKLVDILAEIQSMGLLDETEAMLMKRAMEQISTVQFNKDGDIRQQMEDIQTNIALVMHSSEKTVHKIFKKLSKERGKIENLSWVSEMTRPRSTKSRRVVQLCDRATSPLFHFTKSHTSSRTPNTIATPVTGVRTAGRRPPAQYTAMFAHHDMQHNKRSLKEAVLNHKITPKQYEEAVQMMRDYANIPQKRLQQMAKHYISHARMQIMEENIQLNRPVCDDIDDVLSRLDELYLLRKNRNGTEMDQLAEEREDLAYLLTKQLDRLEHQSGIFLIKPYIAYKAHTLNQHKIKPAVFAQPTQQPTTYSKEPEPELDTGSSWSVGASRTNSNTLYDNWSPEVPRLLEMDVNRITVARNAVSQPTVPGNIKTIRSFVVVRTTKSNQRPRSNATSAEFLSIASERSDDLSQITSDNLPPMRSACTSGFISSGTSRHKLAPITSPPSNIKVEKAITRVT